MKRLIWNLRQLLPLTYRSHYRDAENRRRFCVWKMFLGRAYAIEDYIVGQRENTCYWQETQPTA